MGNVLVHFSHDRMCTQMGSLCGRSCDDVRRLLFDSGLQWNFERGLMTAEQFHERFQECVGQSVPFDDLVHAGSDIFELNASIVPVLDILKARGHRLVLLSNTSVSHFEFVSRNYDVLDRFDDFVLSYQVGAIKPEPAIFEAALNRAGCPAGECFYTDDIPKYVETGRQFGLQAEVFTDTAGLIGQLRQRGIAVDVMN